ncbi:MAG: thioredoxin family protein [Cytophagales bacterium]|nr:thioredoxin family protein [Cytophaga sp.]
MKYIVTTLLAISALLMASFTSTTEDIPAGYKPGDKATDFKLKNINDKIVSLADYSTAKGFIVVFTCNHCPYAIAYEDRVEAIDKKYASKGYPVIAINPNDAASYPEDSFENMKVRAKQKGFTFPYLYDDTQNIAKAYGAQRTPHVYVLEKKGSDLIVQYVGAIDDNSQDASAVKVKYLENTVDELLAGKEVSTKETKAIGCSIKWKK